MLNRRIGKESLRKGPKENGPHGFIYIESIPSPFSILGYHFDETPLFYCFHLKSRFRHMSLLNERQQIVAQKYYSGQHIQV